MNLTNPKQTNPETRSIEPGKQKAGRKRRKKRPWTIMEEP